MRKQNNNHRNNRKQKDLKSESNYHDEQMNNKIISENKERKSMFEESITDKNDHIQRNTDGKFVKRSRDVRNVSFVIVNILKSNEDFESIFNKLVNLLNETNDTSLFEIYRFTQGLSELEIENIFHNIYLLTDWVGVIDKDNEIKLKYARDILNICDCCNFAISEQKNALNNVAKVSNIITDEIYQNIDNKISTSRSEINKELKLLEREYVTVLGILATIIVTFVTSMAFSTSILENLHRASIFRITFVSSILGLILLAILYLQFDFIYHIMQASTDRRSKKLNTNNDLNSINKDDYEAIDNEIEFNHVKTPLLVNRIALLLGIIVIGSAIALALEIIGVLDSGILRDSEYDSREFFVNFSEIINAIKTMIQRTN